MSLKPEPFVSIGVPVYNGERYIRHCLDSLLAQTYEDFEIIISDNASTDDTERICCEYQQRDTRIRYERLPRNLGSVANFNRVFALARGRYFRWAAADDYAEPDHLRRCLEVLEDDQSVALCHTRAKLVDGDSNVIGVASSLDIRDPQPADRFCGLWKVVGLCNACYGLIRSSVLRQTALEGNYLGSDMVLLAEVALHGKIYEIPEYLFYRRFHNEAASSVRELEALQKLYNPSNRKLHHFYNWRKLGGLIAAIHRAPIGMRERLKAFRYVARTGISLRGRMLQELLEGVGLRSDRTPRPESKAISPKDEQAQSPRIP